MMDTETGILLIHAAATWFMVGLIWMIQVVHYPLFARVGLDSFEAYQRSHMTRITWIVAPAMFVELFAAGAVVVLTGSFLAWLGAGLLAAVWAATFAVHVPLHSRLLNGFDARLHRRLVRTNWVRTLLWSARGGVSLILLLSLLESAG